MSFEERIMEISHSDYPDLSFVDVQALARALSDKRRMHGGGDTPAQVAAACLRRHADALDAYGWNPCAARTAAWAALLVGREPDALVSLAEKHCANFVRREP